MLLVNPIMLILRKFMIKRTEKVLIGTITNLKVFG
jgi:hypothetical protein